MGLTKLLAALVEHSSEWLIKNIAMTEVQSMLGLILRLTGWEGTPSVDEQISEVRPPARVLIMKLIADEYIAHTADIPDDPRSNHGLGTVPITLRVRSKLGNRKIVLRGTGRCDTQKSQMARSWRERWIDRRLE